VAAAKGAVEVTEAAEVAMAVVEVRLMEVDAEVAGMAAADMVALLLLMEVVVMAVLLHAQGEFLDIDARHLLTISTATEVASEVAAEVMHHTRLRSGTQMNYSRCENVLDIRRWLWWKLCIIP